MSDVGKGAAATSIASSAIGETDEDNKGDIKGGPRGFLSNFFEDKVEDEVKDGDKEGSTRVVAFEIVEDIPMVLFRFRPLLLDST